MSLIRKAPCAIQKPKVQLSKPYKAVQQQQQPQNKQPYKQQKHAAVIQQPVTEAQRRAKHAQALAIKRKKSCGCHS